LFTFPVVFAVVCAALTSVTGAPADSEAPQALARSPVSCCRVASSPANRSWARRMLAWKRSNSAT
jgi:hypothetical protein